MEAGVAGMVAGVVEAGVAEAGVAEAGVAEVEVAEAGIIEAGVAEAGVAEAGIVEAGVATTGEALGAFSPSCKTVEETELLLTAFWTSCNGDGFSATFFVASALGWCDAALLPCGCISVSYALYLY